MRFDNKNGSTTSGIPLSARVSISSMTTTSTSRSIQAGLNLRYLATYKKLLLCFMIITLNTQRWQQTPPVSAEKENRTTCPLWFRGRSVKIRTEEAAQEHMIFPITCLAVCSARSDNPPQISGANRRRYTAALCICSLTPHPGTAALTGDYGP